MYDAREDAALTARVEEIKETQGDALTLTVVADTHYAATDENRAAIDATCRLAEETGDALVHLGDFIRGYEDRPLTQMKAEMTDAARRYAAGTTVPVLVCKGNHDDASELEWNQGKRMLCNLILPPLMYARTARPFDRRGIVRNPNDRYPMYGYIDFPDRRARCYILNCIDMPYENDVDGRPVAIGQWGYGFRPAQIAWLAKTLADVPDGWLTVFCTHISPVPALWDEGLPMINADVVLELLHAYRDGRPYERAYAPTQETFPATGKPLGGRFDGRVAADFRGTHDVVVLSGHTHKENVLNENGILHIVFPDFYSGVKTDTVIFDRDARKVKILSYGFDHNREYEF